MHLKTKYSTKLKVTGQMTNTDLQQCDTAKTSQIITAALVRGTAFNLTLNGKKPIWISLLALSRYITDALLNEITNTEKQKGDHVKML